jgi:hypothetical protein
VIRKGYINRYKSREPNHEIVGYWFCDFAKDAAHWDTQESAAFALSLFNRGIEIPSCDGGIYSCRDFKVEEFATDQFVIYCEAPFTYTEHGTSVSNA